MSRSVHGWTLLTCSFTLKSAISGSSEAVCKQGVMGFESPDPPLPRWRYRRSGGTRSENAVG